MSERTIAILGLGNIGFSVLRKITESDLPVNLILIDSHYPDYLDQYLKSKEKKGNQKIFFHKTNCTSKGEVENLGEQLKSEKIDVIVSTIGVLTTASPLKDYHKFKEAFTVNFFGNILPIKELLPLTVKNKSSRIIIITSTSGNKAPKSSNAYSPSKWALENFSSSLRTEVKNENIYVDIIRPTNIKNEFSKSFKIEKGMHPDKIASKIFALILKNYGEEKTAGENYFIPFYFNAIRIIERVFPCVLDRLAKLKNSGTRSKRYKQAKIDTVLITGASSGLGKELTFLYAKRTKAIIITGRNIKSLNAIKDQISKESPCKITTVELDLCDFNSVVRFTENIEQVDLLINNAAMYSNKPFNQMEMEEYQKILDTNFFAPVFITSELIKKGTLKKVITILSTTAIAGRRNHSGYSASKAALWSFTRSLRRQFGNDIHIVEAIPSTFESNLFRELENKKIKNKNAIQASDVATKIYQCEQQGKDRVFIPYKSKLYLYLEALCFPLFQKIFMK